MKKILVGILYCGENEYDQCKEAIQRQTLGEWDWFFVENLPAKDAHHQLYRSFEENRDQYELFVKIDADMVLVNRNFFENLCEYVKSTKYSHWEFYVQDYFTGRLIPSLHVYDSEVRFRVESEETICFDHVHDGMWTQVISERKLGLVPAAYHCMNPSEFAAFHYGAHRGIKYHEKSERGYLRSILYCFSNYLRNLHEPRIWLAFLGGYVAVSRRIPTGWVNYENPDLVRVFEEVRGNRILGLRAVCWCVLSWCRILWDKSNERLKGKEIKTNRFNGDE